VSATVAIVGATGAVGQVMLSVLEERDFPASSIRLLASERSAGREVATSVGPVVVEDLAQADPAGIDIALFSAGGERSLLHAGRFVEAGVVVIDNSSAWRMDPAVPLVVAGVNDHAVKNHHGLIANPNCTTMTLLMGVAPLHRAAGLHSMVVSSYQAVSGSGNKGVEELVHQAELLGKDVDLLRDGGWTDPVAQVYSRPIGWNVLPFAGNAVDGGYTDEEMKLVNESRKILEAPDLEVQPTCVRVPVVAGHGSSATLRFDRPMEVAEALQLLDEADGVQVWSDQVPTPLDSAGIDDVLVGRVRPTLDVPGGINLWTVGDNLRKGAALNTVQIAELL